MDRAGFERAGGWLGDAGRTGIEFTGGLTLEVEQGSLGMAGDGGDFTLRVSGKAKAWPARVVLQPGDVVEIPAGGLGQLRLSEIRPRARGGAGAGQLRDELDCRAGRRVAEGG